MGDDYRATSGCASFSCNGAFSNNCCDHWGYPCGQCTSFAADRVAQAGKDPRGLGAAFQWAGNASARGWPVDGTARIGDIVGFPPGCMGAGGNGHVAYVTGVGGGRIQVEQYNYNDGSGWCRYSQVSFGIGCGMRFIHIGGSPSPPPPPPPPPSDPCAGVTCPGCSMCSGGVCYGSCPSGWICTSLGVCTPPPSPPPGSGATSNALFLGGLVLGAIAGAGYWEARRHPGATTRILRELEGPGAVPHLGRRVGVPMGVPIRRRGSPTAHRAAHHDGFGGG